MLQIKEENRINWEEIFVCPLFNDSADNEVMK